MASFKLVVLFIYFCVCLRVFVLFFSHVSTHPKNSLWVKMTKKRITPTIHSFEFVVSVFENPKWQGFTGAALVYPNLIQRKLASNTPQRSLPEKNTSNNWDVKSKSCYIPSLSPGMLFNGTQVWLVNHKNPINGAMSCLYAMGSFWLPKKYSDLQCSHPPTSLVFQGLSGSNPFKGHPHDGSW